MMIFRSSFFVSPSGNVFIAGTVDTDATSAINNDFVALKYNSVGGLQWSKLYANNSVSNDVPKAIVEDGQGNIIITGYTESIPQKMELL